MEVYDNVFLPALSMTCLIFDVALALFWHRCICIWDAPHMPLSPFGEHLVDLSKTNTIIF